MMRDHHIYCFANGLRFIYKQVKATRIFHGGYTIDIGSRDEQEHQQGIAHFWEHLAFKGTTRRSATRIINSLDSLGGELNAYTTKEKICFHASVPMQAAKKAIDVLTDIVFNPTFPEKEIEKERRVILEEMSMYNEDYADMIGDEFESIIFQGHELGRSIMGTRETVERFKRKDFFDFLAQNINYSKIVFSAVGPHNFEQILKMFAEAIEPVDINCHQTHLRVAFSKPQVARRQVEKDTLQAHCVIGGRAYPISDSRRVAFSLLMNVLGGPSMNSRLNMQLRERYGLVYSVEAQYNAYTDAGNFMVQFACEARNLNRCKEIVYKELKRFIQNPLTKSQLRSAQNQMKGQITMAEESNLTLMQVLGKSLLDLGRVETLPEVLAQVDAIQSADLQAIAVELFAEEKISELVYVPAA